MTVLLPTDKLTLKVILCWHQMSPFRCQIPTVSSKLSFLVMTSGAKIQISKFALLSLANLDSSPKTELSVLVTLH